MTDIKSQIIIIGRYILVIGMTVTSVSLYACKEKCSSNLDEFFYGFNILNLDDTENVECIDGNYVARGKQITVCEARELISKIPPKIHDCKYEYFEGSDYKKDWVNDDAWITVYGSGIAMSGPISDAYIDPDSTNSVMCINGEYQLNNVVMSKQQVLDWAKEKGLINEFSKPRAF